MSSKGEHGAETASEPGSRVSAILRMEAGLEAIDLLGPPLVWRTVALTARVTGVVVATLAVAAGMVTLLSGGSLSGDILLISGIGAASGLLLSKVGKELGRRADELDGRREAIEQGLYAASQVSKCSQASIESSEEHDR